MCEVDNYIYSTMLDTYKCFCGDANVKYYKDGHSDQSNCEIECNDHQEEKCAKANAMAVYKICPKDKFGEGCSRDCHCGNTSDCHIEDGRCLDEKGTCSIGWETWPMCKNVCRNGTYGFGCSGSCPRCRGETCHRIHGTCELCPSGFYGDFCHKVCPSGSYGFGCSSHCPTNCEDNVCNPVNGRCNSCVTGFSGDNCATASKSTGLIGEKRYVIIATMMIYLVEDYLI